MYDKKDDVVELTASNFDSKVLNGDEIWIVEFYAPWSVGFFVDFFLTKRRRGENVKLLFQVWPLQEPRPWIQESSHRFERNRQSRSCGHDCSPVCWSTLRNSRIPYAEDLRTWQKEAYRLSRYVSSCTFSSKVNELVKHWLTPIAAVQILRRSLGIYRVGRASIAN